MANIIPFLWFVSQAEEAVAFYVSLFRNSKIESISRYGEAGPLPAGTAMTVEFQLNGQDFMALNGGTPAVGGGPVPVALFVSCDSQDEVDRLWDALLEGGKAIQCGWLVDRYGIPWNIVPQGLGELLRGDDAEGSQRAMRAMLKMVKLDIHELRRAYGLHPQS